MITISFEPLTGSRWNTPTQRMRGLLKVALRGFGFRCVMIKEEVTEMPQDDLPHTNTPPASQTFAGAPSGEQG